MKNICPVCNYDGLDEAPYNENGSGSYEICPCCGFQFGLDDYPDKEEGISSWREKWATSGYKWFSASIKPPEEWDGEKQLKSEN